MRLIKDLNNSGNAFYSWLTEDGENISGNLPTNMSAHEWWTRHLFSQYEGLERRSSIYDRRRDLRMRKIFDLEQEYARLFYLGRRKTDKAPEIHLDLFKIKIQKFKALG
jgi:hypothetical protein